MNTSPAKLLFITGFLGSGKTTLLNHLLHLLDGKRVGVIVNEWGDINIDAGLINHEQGEEIIELSGGQIFCSCLSGSFVNAVVKLASLDLDYILTEASGLAKPSVLMEIVREAEKRSAGKLVYHGMICIIDASRFLILREVVNAVDEQVAYSDRFLLNKVDLASPEDIESIKRVLGELRPGYPQFEAVKAEADPAILRRPIRTGDFAVDPKYKGWGSCGRPVSCTIRPQEPVDRADLINFLTAAGAFSYRIKGYAPLLPEGKLHLVDCVGEDVVVAGTAADADPASGFVLISKGAVPPAEDVQRTWKAHLSVPVIID